MQPVVPTTPFADVRRYSLERLIRIAFQKGLLTDYRMTPTSVYLYLRHTSRDLEPEEARQFLYQLLRRYRAVPASRDVAVLN